MPRFFVPAEQIQNGRFRLSGSEAHHLITVLRKQPGDVIDIFDGRDASYRAQIDSISENELSGRILEQATSSTVRFDLILCQALIKGPKWDWLLEKACEIGVRTIVPLQTARTVVQISREDVEKLERWRRIALAASKQCGRSDVMAIESPMPLSRLLERKELADLWLIPWEKEGARSVSQACAGKSAKSAAVLIGPEGGWENLEVEQAERAGALPVRLGPTLLRSETAGIVASTLVLREFDIY